MKTITLSAILEDLQAADQAIRRFEQRYWLSSRQFYDLCMQGALDDGEHGEDFSEWAGFYKLKLKREQALEQLSQERLARLPRQTGTNLIEITGMSHQISNTIGGPRQESRFGFRIYRH